MDRPRYVAFGHSHVIGDLIEVIDATGGVLAKIVQNVPEVSVPHRPSLADRLARLQDPAFNPHRVNDAYPIAIEPLSAFEPQAGDRYLIGFTGFKMANLVESLQERFGIRCATLVHPTASIAPSAQLAPGTIIQAGAIVAARARLAPHVFVNKGVRIGSSSAIGRYSSLAPGVAIGRDVTLGTGVTLGIGSHVLDGMTVQDYATVAAGACVITTAERNTLVAGVPAILKRTQFHSSLTP